MRWRTIAAALLALPFCACSAPADTTDAETASEDPSSIPSPYLPSVIAGLKWMHWLEENHPEWYVSSEPGSADARVWGDAYDPGKDPVFAHNEIEIAGVTPHDVLALLKSGRSDTYYPNSSAATERIVRANGLRKSRGILPHAAVDRTSHPRSWSSRRIGS
jgi:hypothetical protein